MCFSLIVQSTALNIIHCYGSTGLLPEVNMLFLPQEIPQTLKAQQNCLVYTSVVRVLA